MTLRIVIVLVAVFVAALLVPAPVLGEFPEGREVYVKRCLPCHQRKKIDYDPAAYTQRAMREMVARMSPMSKLGNDEQMAVASYLEAGRTGGVKVPPIVLPATGQPAVSTNEFAVAQELCLTKCASCHAHKLEPINPEKYTGEKLKGWVERMAPIARFTTEQTALAGRYLEAVRTKNATWPASAAIK
ncbi:MAG: cytochrome c [Verrucomicrobia bacterium]|nr:cytochrome c [Verrucomicrobiota bacterium]